MHLDDARGGRLWSIVWGVCLLAGSVVGRLDVAEGAPEYRPQVAPASDEAAQALARVKAPPGLAIDLVAAEPLLANPVAFCFDERGRIYVAETFRHHAGVSDNRLHMEWLDADLAAETVEDRVAMYRKYLGEGFVNYTLEHERVRRLADLDGDGRYEHSTVFADGFRDPADGIAAGLLARDGQVWFTCIPHLWLLRDTDDDGRADERQALHSGFGVHVAFLGHDLHGLRQGPDGKLYFSIGDRGFHVATPAGTLAYPHEGAVLRMNPDGSELEVVHRGLRNPQELAFDEYGNLFTGDNNSDGGDKARWVWIVEGGDSAWRMSFQYLSEPVLRGPWNAEQLWVPRPAEPARWHTPPLANLGDGPAGLTYYPGTGWGAEYRGQFFLCDFRGASLLSGVRTFRLAPAGASFAVVDSRWFVQNLLATDCEFGPDGGLYISDWVEGWEKPHKGRIQRVRPAEGLGDRHAAGVRELLAGGLAGKPLDELVLLLEHPDQRLRQEAQFALAREGGKSRAALEKRLADRGHQLARIHALWALGQQATADPRALEQVAPLLDDDDPELRAQAAKLLGDRRHLASQAALVELVRDPSPRVRFFAAQGLGKLAQPGAAAALAELLRANDDADPYLRHAAVTALARLGDPAALEPLVADSAAAVRLGALLALRKLGDPGVTRFLDDGDPALAVEAARAIYDVPIRAGLAALADRLASGRQASEAWWRRAINAAYLLGTADRAATVAQVATREDVPAAIRREALDLLADWTAPPPRDRVLGHWRPLEPRPFDWAAAAAAPVIERLLADPDAQLVARAAELAGGLKLTAAVEKLSEVASNSRQATAARRAALAALLALEAEGLHAVVSRLADDSATEVRSLALDGLARLAPAEALPRLLQVLDTAKPREQQAALATLAGLDPALTEAPLAGWLERLLDGKLPPELELDLVEAAAAHPAPQLAEKLAAYRNRRSADDPLAAYRACLSGGNAAAGRKLFFERAELSCVRCHHIKGEGGAVGPELSRIASQMDRAYLLESVVLPNRQIAKGFESVVVATDSGQVLSGVLRAEHADRLELLAADGQLLIVPKDAIEERTSGPSAMPEKLHERLTLRELRDLIEYLASLR